jgi:hypothetical protein
MSETAFSHLVQATVAVRLPKFENRSFPGRFGTHLTVDFYRFIKFLRFVKRYSIRMWGKK